MLEDVEDEEVLLALMLMMTIMESEPEDSSVPPDPLQGARHPRSDPKEWQRKESVQCQHCYRPKTESGKMWLCSGCKIEIYCVRVHRLSFFCAPRNASVISPFDASLTRQSQSKECQRNAWKNHKGNVK